MVLPQVLVQSELHVNCTSFYSQAVSSVSLFSSHPLSLSLFTSSEVVSRIASHQHQHQPAFKTLPRLCTGSGSGHHRLHLHELLAQVAYTCLPTACSIEVWETLTLSCKASLIIDPLERQRGRRIFYYSKPKHRRWPLYP